MSDPSLSKACRVGARVFETEAGWMSVLATDQGVVLVAGPGPDTAFSIKGERFRRGSFGPTVDALLDRAEEQLTAYYAGRRVNFDLPLDVSVHPPFRRKALLETAKVPYGETVTYGELAVRCGSPKAARAVGHAMSRNPLAPIVPCHRVIGADGSLVGFGGGLDEKARLLEMERKALREDART